MKGTLALKDECLEAFVRGIEEGFHGIVERIGQTKGVNLSDIAKQQIHDDIMNLIDQSMAILKARATYRGRAPELSNHIPIIQKVIREFNIDKRELVVGELKKEIFARGVSTYALAYRFSWNMIGYRIARKNKKQAILVRDFRAHQTK